MVSQEHIEAVIPMVQAMAWRWSRRLPPRIDRLDIVQDGMVGLMRAANDYDQADGRAKFSSFAYRYINGEIADNVRRYYQLPKQRREWLREGTAEAIAEDTGRNQDRVSRTLQRQQALRALADGSGPDAAMIPWLARQTVPESDYIQALTIQAVQAAMMQLPHRDRQVLLRFYFKGDTTTQIARVFNVTQATASKWHIKAVNRLKVALER